MTGDEQAIQEIVSRMENAWNLSDSKAYAELFVEDANFIHIFGGQLDGRPAIQASHQHIFDTIYKGSRATLSVLNVRFVRPDVALAFTRAHLSLLEGGPFREIDARPTLIVAKEQGKWQIVALQNTRVSEMPV